MLETGPEKPFPSPFNTQNTLNHLSSVLRPEPGVVRAPSIQCLLKNMLPSGSIIVLRHMPHFK